MTREEVVRKTLARLGFTPTQEQAHLVHALGAFASAHAPRDIFVLNGYAGTGKTSVMGAFTNALADCGKRSVILAPTGRAAKVASALSGRPAFTIHKRIFRGNSTDPGNTSFFLAPNTDRDTLFIIDEASLIGDSTIESQSLIGQLVRHVYSAPGCAMILVGDIAQLPPVGLAESPAMNLDRLTQLGLNPIYFSLDNPVRQQTGSGILYNATMARSFLSGKYEPDAYMIYQSGYDDVDVISSRDLADILSESWGEVGEDETLIITRSNRRANDYNRAIRNLVMGAEDPLQRGDRIVIAKNDYYWSQTNKMKSFLANGETAELTWVGRAEKKYGRYFADVEMRLNGEEAEIGAKIMLRSLVAEGPQLPRLEMERLYQRVMAECEGAMSDKIKFAMQDPYFNALQAKYAYCVTCHKAQGGQWRHVYIDMGAIDYSAIDQTFYRWLYTAMTRATEKLFLINPPFLVE